MSLSPLWHILEPAPNEFLEAHADYHPLVANLLYQRGLRTAEEIHSFLHPDYNRDIHDPFLFRDMRKAVDRLYTAIEKDETITIHGDYDADGVCASTVLTDALEILGAKHVNVYLPHRETDGYGLNKKTIQLLHDQGTKVIITCDCGISNAPEVALANELGIDVIITDHHSIPEHIPAAHSIIHPKIEDEPYPDKNLAGAGVAFKLVQGLLRTHAENNETLPDGQSHESFEKWLLDMVAIASVADMVPLIGESRTLTAYGLLVLNKTRRLGMKKLLIEAGIREQDGKQEKLINTRTIGFQIAPRINAAGRLDHANVAYKLFVETIGTEAVNLAWRLDQNNIERRSITDEAVDLAIAMVEKEQKDKPLLCVYHPNWATGIVGLIASRLKSQYHKPSIAMGNNSGTITGSGRSIEGFNLVEALQSNADYFAKFGGHPMACGFSMKDPEQRDAMHQALIDTFNKKTEDLDLRPKLHIDSELSLDDINDDLFEQLELFKPFGQKNEKIRYAAFGVRVVTADAMGKNANHLRLSIQHHSARVFKAIGWGLCDPEDRGEGKNWSQYLSAGDMIDLVFEIEENEWKGNRSLQLMIVDLRKAE